MLSTLPCRLLQDPSSLPDPLLTLTLYSDSPGQGQTSAVSFFLLTRAILGTTQAPGVHAQQKLYE